MTDEKKEKEKTETASPARRAPPKVEKEVETKWKRSSEDGYYEFSHEKKKDRFKFPVEAAKAVEECLMKDGWEAKKSGNEIQITNSELGESYVIPVQVLIEAM